MLKEFKNKFLERKLNNINILIEENRKLQEVEKDDIKLYK